VVTDTDTFFFRYDNANPKTLDECLARLTAAQNLKMVQGNALLEGISGGVMPNSYLFLDLNRMYQPMRAGAPYGDPEPWPMMYIEEEASCCSKDCCCRICCSPRHPALLKFYLATDPYDPGDCTCCGSLCWHNADLTEPNEEAGAFMTLERFGCCQRFANCFVCCECCQDEMRMHEGNVGQPGDAGSLPDDKVLVYGKVPIGGGGCTPTVELFKKAPGQKITAETPGEMVAVVEGPMCFGGCKDFLCDTEFTISTTHGLAADLGKITKKTPSGCSEWCMACCSTADTYNLWLTDSGKAMPPADKAMYLAEMVHLDYMFFEQDKFPCEMQRQGDVTWCNFLMCLCYCYGCLCPIKCSVPIHKDGNDMSVGE